MLTPRALPVGWPRRRWIVAAVATAAAAAVFVALGGGRGWGPVVAALSAVLTGATIATYVAPDGRMRLTGGCAPCAGVSLLLVVTAVLARGGAPADPAMAGLSLLLLVAALGRRLRGERSCGTSVPRGLP